MKKAPEGIYVPLITTFNEDETINWENYKKVIDHVIDNGVDGLLVGGTTGEYHVMSFEERKELIKHGCEFAAGRVPVLAGIGCFTARETIELGNWAAECGADYGLVLPPYYHHTSDQGILDFFKEVADNTEVGIMIYYYPGATAVDVTPEMVYEMAQHENIIGIKDSADMTHTAKTVALTQDLDNFSVYTGEEHMIVPTLAVGGKGAFGILINLLPKEFVEIYHTIVDDNDIAKAAALNKRLNKTGIYELMEKEPYPGPAKAGMDAIGLPGGILRKPLTQPSDEMRKAMAKALKELGYDAQ